MFEQFTKEARAVVRAAVDLAERRTDSHVGTEHLLVAVAEAGNPSVASAFESVGVAASGPREALDGLDAAALQGAGIRLETPMPLGRAPGRRRHRPFTDGAKSCLEDTLRQAIRQGDRRLGVEHIALALCSRSPRDPASLVIERLEVKPETLYGALQTQLRRGA